MNVLNRSRIGWMVVTAAFAAALAAALVFGGPEQAVAGGPDGPAGEPNLGVHEHQAGGVDVVLLELARGTGGVVTARWRYVNRTGESKRLTQERTGWIDPYRLAADAYLLDAVNRVKYTVMTDDDRRPIADRHGRPNAYIVIAPGQTLTTWAKFQAPAPGVTRVTVSIPGTEPFEDVPLR